MAALGEILWYKFGSNPGFSVRDNSDGKGPFIEEWDDAVMGRSTPTTQEIIDWDAEVPAKKAAIETGQAELKDIKSKLDNDESLSAAEMRTALKKLLRA